jgi:hypothetical protein
MKCYQFTVHCYPLVAIRAGVFMEGNGGSRAVCLALLLDGGDVLLGRVDSAVGDWITISNDSSIHFSSMSNPHHFNGFFLLITLIDGAIVSSPDAPVIF